MPDYKATLTFFIVLVSAWLLPSALFAAEDAYMSVEGAVQGVIAGDVTQAGREDTFAINEVHHLIHHNASATQHEPLIVMTDLSKGAPLLLQALDTQESLTVAIDFWRVARSGQMVMFYRMELTGARLVAAEPMMFDNQTVDGRSLPERIRLRFDYDQITHIYQPDQTVTLTVP